MNMCSAQAIEAGTEAGTAAKATAEDLVRRPSTPLSDQGCPCIGRSYLGPLCLAFLTCWPTHAPSCHALVVETLDGLLQR
jgi:hypothetical protein